MRRIDHFELIFENCESFEVSVNSVGVFHIDDIGTKIDRIAVNSISEMTIAGEIAIEFFKKADEEYNPFGFEDKSYSKLKRIRTYNDISSIKIFFTDGTDSYIYPVYNEKSDNSNDYQKTLVSNLGNVYVVISKDKNIEDFFDLREINSKSIKENEEEIFEIGVKQEKEQEYSSDNLPMFYRYVYLQDDRKKHNYQVLAIRVFDAESGFKYIYGDGTPEIIDFPTKFLYPTTSIEKFLDTKNFTVKRALEKYPLPDNFDESSPVYKYFLQAKEDVKRTY